MKDIVYIPMQDMTPTRDDNAPAAAATTAAATATTTTTTTTTPAAAAATNGLGSWWTDWLAPQLGECVLEGCKYQNGTCVGQTFACLGGTAFCVAGIVGLLIICKH